MADELRQPLRRRRLADHLLALRPSPLRAATIVVAAAGLALGVWLARSPAPVGGHIVRVAIQPFDPVTTSTVEGAGEPAADEGGEAQREVLPSPEDVAADEALAGREVAALTPRETPLTAAPIRAVSEPGPFGLLPRVAADGHKPFDLYARPLPAALARSGSPRIALTLGGMGLNPKLTRKAIRELPGAVTLAFAPYGNDLQKLVNEARADGHEVMLHLPMEPFGYPTIDPGPRTLVAGEGSAENLDRLMWLMSRFAGYTGIVNYMGARLTADEAALRPILTEIGRRGLVYLDDGSSARSLAGDIAHRAGVPMRRAGRVIDASPAYDDVIVNLNLLEEEARQSGLAMGTGSGLPVTIDAVSAWARGLADRGVTLVPASAAYR